MDCVAAAQPAPAYPHAASNLPAWQLGWCCAAAMAGVWAQLQQAALWAPWAYACVAVAGLLALWVGRCWRRRMPFAWGMLWLLAGVAAVVFALTGARALQRQAHILAPELQGRDVQVLGTLAAMPQPTQAGVRLRIAVESAQLAGLPVRLPPWVDVTWYQHSTSASEDGALALPPAASLQAGERWALTLRLKAPHGARNPQGFDYELWLWEQGVGATGYVRTGPHDAPPRRLGMTPWHPVEYARQSVRAAIFARLAPDASDSARLGAAGVVAALVTGDQQAIERSDWELFRTTGVAHLMSISGLHITLFAWLASALVGRLWRCSARLCLAWPAPSAGLLGGLLLAALYALFSGWGVPAQRTVTMLAVVVGLRLSGRRWPWPQVCVLAAAVAVLVDPWALLQPGFWLSFVAVAMLFATNIVADSAYSVGLKGLFCSLIHTQAVVTLALTPLGLVFFGQLSLVGWLANVLAIPWVTWVLTPLALAGVVLAPLWSLALWAVQVLVGVLQWFAAWPWAALWLPMAPWGVGALAVLGGAWLALRLPWALRWLGLALVLPVLLWQHPRPEQGQFEVQALDVGQGSAVLVRTATHSLLYDTGPRYGPSSNAGERVLLPYLRAQGEHLDMVVLSHRDSDHTGGAGAVLAQHAAAQVLGSIEGDAALQALRPHTPCSAGQAWVWDGVRFEVLHPVAPPGWGASSKAAAATNAHSCVLRVRTASGVAALLAGDIEAAQEAQLLARTGDVRANVLLLPHHGSKTSSSAAFLDAVQPQWALVQAGYRNRFGHPHPLVLERLHARGIGVVQTPACGAAQWASQNAGVVRCERQERQRYWQHNGGVPK